MLSVLASHECRAHTAHAHIIHHDVLQMMTASPARMTAMREGVVALEAHLQRRVAASGKPLPALPEVPRSRPTPRSHAQPTGPSTAVLLAGMIVLMTALSSLTTLHAQFPGSALEARLHEAGRVIYRLPAAMPQLIAHGDSSESPVHSHSTNASVFTLSLTMPGQAAMRVDVGGEEGVEEVVAPEVNGTLRAPLTALLHMARSWRYGYLRAGLAFVVWVEHLVDGEWVFDPSCVVVRSSGSGGWAGSAGAASAVQPSSREVVARLSPACKLRVELGVGRRGASAASFVSIDLAVCVPEGSFQVGYGSPSVPLRFAVISEAASVAAATPQAAANAQRGPAKRKAAKKATRAATTLKAVKKKAAKKPAKR